MAHEHYASRSHPEFVALDIGGGVGALIVHTGADMHGVEVEISPSGDDTARSHKQVLERFSGSRSAYTLVYDRLAAGTYTLWADGQDAVRGVAVRDGEITEIGWPGDGRAVA
jgi:hypothetical protein